MKLTLVLALANIHFCISQNLVPNPGFEEFYSCPGTFNINFASRKVAPGWESPTNGTPDLFNDCSKGPANASHNWAGVSNFHSGNGYVGLYVWLKGERNYREYVQTRLRYALTKGRKYKVEFYFKFSSYSRYSIDRIGVLLLDTAYNSNQDNLILATPTISKVYDSAFRRTTGLWEKVSCEYEARGFEQYLIIGNFFNNGATKSFHVNFEPVQEPMLANACYFYIDDVSVIDIDSIALRKDIQVADQNTKLNETYVLENIQFEYNRSDLKSISYLELNKWITILQKNISWQVLLEGHTDEVGSNEFNQQLSEGRAKTVARFLVEHGIDKSRISTRGFGKQKPLNSGNNEAARSKNRRVEITFAGPSDAPK